MNDEYRQPRQPSPAWVSQLSEFLYFRSPFTLLISVGLMLAAMLVLWRQKAANPHGLVPAALMLLSYPLMFMVWHGDAGEIERHSALIGICFRLSSWMLVFWLVDNNQPRKKPVQISEE